DPEDAKAQFISTLTRDRADRGLDQAREELAKQLPRHTMAVHPRIRRYIDNMSRLMARTETTMEKLQPVADYHAKVQVFKDRYQATPNQAHDEARATEQAAAAKGAELDAARDQLHRQTLSQVRSEIQNDISQLQVAEQRARDAGFFTRAKAKHDARTMRQQLEDRYGIPLPGTDKERFNQSHRGQDTEWVHIASPAPPHPQTTTTSRPAPRPPSGSTPQHTTTSRATHPMKHPWTACIRKSNTSTAKRTRLVNEPRLSNKHGTPTSDQHQTLRVTAPIRTTSRPSSDMPRPKT